MCAEGCSRSFAVWLFAAGFLFGSWPVGAQEMAFVESTAAAGIPPDHGGGQLTWGDYNNDGYEDLLIGCGDLYRNSGPPGYSFTKALSLSGGNGGTWADIDNDGDLDIFCTSGVNALWINNGDGTFSNATSTAGLTNTGCQGYTGTCGCTSSDAWCPWSSWPFTGAAWGDFDADGLIDLYVGNYETWNGSAVLCWPDFLYRNNGDQTFADVSLSSGIRDSDGDGTSDELYTTHPEEDRRCVRGVTWGDYNNDNFPDIYISNYRIMPNTLWENLGTGSFRNVAAEKGCATADSTGDQGHTLGSDWGDMDNDGDLDLYTADLAHSIYWYALGHDASALYRNNGGGSSFNFSNIRPQSGMEQMSTARNDWTETNPVWGDADNDGDLDIFVGQIYMYDSYFSRMYRNDGTLSGITTFTDMDNFYGDCPADPKQSPASGAHCLKTWYTFSAAWADYDNDGRLDLAISGSDYWVACENSDADPDGECQYHGIPDVEKPHCTISDPNTWCQPQWFHLYRNVTANGNHWLEVRLRAETPENNGAGIGARITAVAGGKSMIRDISGGTGYHSTQNSLRAHFGLGSATLVDTLTVRWPDGTEVIRTDVAADQILELTDVNCTTETCNGRDDDCDGTIDEGFPDADLDGAAVCIDCGDEDETIHPGAADACDGVDQDCDGVDGVGHDADHDHYSTVCPPIDCHDNDAGINPGAVEIPYNLMDDDCRPETRDDDLDEDGYFTLWNNLPKVDDVTSGETEVSNGGVTGTHLNTHVSDDAYETLTEKRVTQGSTTTSQLIHRFTIPVTAAAGHVFKVEAHHSANSEGDDFEFDYWSGGGFTPMLTVIKTADDDTAQSFTLPAGLSGDLLIRVVDKDRTHQNTSLDWIAIDRMWIESASNPDCDDSDPQVNPEATELCNLIDDDCDGTVDDGAGGPGRILELLLPVLNTLEWDPVTGASSYDVVKGDLGLLRSSAGDFTTSILTCLEDNSLDASSKDDLNPSSGQGFYYLTRSFGCGQNGTYDDGTEAGPRDAEVGASPAACP